MQSIYTQKRRTEHGFLESVEKDVFRKNIEYHRKRQ